MGTSLTLSLAVAAVFVTGCDQVSDTLNGRSPKKDIAATVNSGGATSGSMGGGAPAEDVNTGSGGASSSGGDQPVGGTTVATGGAPGTGGAAWSGGVVAAAGSVSNSGGDITAGGGRSGAGGAMSTGGTTSSGGSGGSGGGAASMGGTNAGSGGSSATTGIVPPSPVALPGTACTTQLKGAPCSGSDVCSRYCGPESQGSKTETCSGGTYVESSCLFSSSTNYACYAIASVAACGGGPPTAGSDCSIPQCQPCGSSTATAYYDSAGTAKVGYCVCASNGKWSCASATAWPCPAGQGC